MSPRNKLPSNTVQLGWDLTTYLATPSAQQMSLVIHQCRYLSCAIASRASGTWQTTKWSAQTRGAPLALAGHWQIASCHAVVLMASAGIQAWLQSPFGGHPSKWTFQVLQRCLAAGKVCTRRSVDSKCYGIICSFCIWKSARKGTIVEKRSGKLSRIVNAL